MNAADQRPRVLVNFAMTANGRMANPDGSQLAISNEEDKAAVHALRNEHDAILVGINTVLSDDPKLTVKPKYVKAPRNPTRVVLDSNGRTPKDALVVDNEAKTIIVTNAQCRVAYENASVLRCGEGRVNILDMLSILHQKGIRSLMVEGGPTVIRSFLEAGVVDLMRVFVGGTVAGGNPAFPEGMDGVICEKMKICSVTTLGSGMVIEYELK